VKITSRLFPREGKIYFEKMNASELFGNWNVTLAKLEQQYVTFSDNSLSLVEGKRDKMKRKPQLQLDETKANCTSLSHGYNFYLTIKL